MFSDFSDEYLERMFDTLRPKLSEVNENWPVKNSNWKVLETRGEWELYEFSKTRERNWCHIEAIKQNGISYVFYDPDIDPMWSPPEVEKLKSWFD